jgi:hypothetical protein
VSAGGSRDTVGSVEPDAPSPGHPRLSRALVATALATGTALVAVGAGGMVNVDHKLQAATPAKPAHPAARGTCPGRHHHHSQQLRSDS